MHIVVVGCGKVGSRFARLVINEGHDVAVVDSDPKNLKRLEPNFEGIVVRGVPIDQDILREAGTDIADALVAVTNDDNMNIMVCQIARKVFNVKRAVARIYSPERAALYSDNFDIETFCPTNSTVEAMHALMLGDKDVARHMIGPNSFIFRHMKVQKKNEHRKVGMLQLDSDEKVFGLIRNEGFVFPDSDIVLNEGDVIVYVSKESKGEHI